MKNQILIKLSVIFLFSVIACQSDIGKISNAKKSMVFPGVPQAKKFIKYQAEVELYKPVSVSKIVIENENGEMQLNNFSFIHLPDGKIMKNNQILPEGKYMFGANVDAVETLANSDDELKITILVEGKEKTLQVKVTQGDPVFGK